MHTCLYLYIFDLDIYIYISMPLAPLDGTSILTHCRQHHLPLGSEPGRGELQSQTTHLHRPQHHLLVIPQLLGGMLQCQSTSAHSTEDLGAFKALKLSHLLILTCITSLYVAMLCYMLLINTLSLHSLSSSLKPFQGAMSLLSLSSGRTNLKAPPC